MFESGDIIAKYNYWDSLPTNLGYIRSDYVSDLQRYLNNNLIKVLQGQRRAGKSYIIRQFIHHLITALGIPAHNILYLNFELEKLNFIKSKDKFSSVVDWFITEIAKPGKKYFFFDEIQEVSEWETLISSLLADHTIEVEIFITGSNSHLLSSELATYISGRYICKHIFPFSYQEYLGFYQHANTRNQFIDYLNFTGLPECFRLPDRELQYAFISAMRDTILLKDVVDRYQIQHIALLELLFQFLTDNIGNLFSVNALVRKLASIGHKTNTMTLSNYIHYLENTYLLHGVGRYDIKGKKILEGEKKYYINDLGISNFLSSSFDNRVARQLENYVFTYLIQNGYHVYVGTLPNGEIDFIAEKRNEKRYIQVAYLLAEQKTIEREFGQLERIDDNWPKYVITLDELKLPAKHGILHLQIWDLDTHFKA